jgi:hypothetical protein
MPTSTFRRTIASWLVLGLLAPIPALAAPPAPATLKGTVFAADGTKPLAGAVVVVTDAAGHPIASKPTAADGVFEVKNIAPGTCTVALESGTETYPIATPVALAPGQTRGVQVALKSKGKKKGGAAAAPGYSGGAMGAMIAVIVGFVAAGAIAVDKANNDETPASPFEPGD